MSLTALDRPHVRRIELLWATSPTTVATVARSQAYLTDRIGNFAELEPYLDLWSAVPCENGVLEIVVVEHDAESFDVPRIEKGTDGRALR